jgi:ABC-type branched-subunit amino acid transport system permease subunit
MSGTVVGTAIINGLLTGGVYSLVAIGLTLIWGVMGVANFAHGAFLMVGMYTAYWLFALAGIDPFLGIFASMAVMFIVGWYMQKYLVNKIMDAPHYNQFLLTIGVSIFLENLALFLWPDYRQLNVSYRSIAFSVGAGYRIELVRLFAFLIAAVLSISLYCFLKLTDLGKAIRSSSQNKVGAQVVGINVWKIYILTFAIGAACAGAAGAVISPYYPTSHSVGSLFILVAFVVVCIGGMGNLLGAMVGGLIIGLAESLGTLIIPGGQKELVTYTIFILVLLFRPQGLFPFAGYWQAQIEEKPHEASKQKPVKVVEGSLWSKFPLSFYYWIIGGILITFLLIIPLFGNNYLTHIILEMLLLAYLGQAWNIMCGYTGQLSFGHATFFGVGAYVSSLLFVKLGISPWIGMFLGGGLSLLIGVGIGAVSLRYNVKGVFFAFSTLCIAEIFRLLSLFWVSLTNGASGILLPWAGHNPLMFSFAVQKKYMYYYTILAMLLGCTYLAHKIKKIRLGYYLFAIRGNEEAAESLGINTAKFRRIAIGISAFLTALGGTFYAQYYQHFEPEEVFGPLRSFDVIFPVILGGGGNVVGPIIGAFVLQSFEEITRAIMPPLLHGFHRMLYGVLIVVMIMYLPSGIVSLIEEWKDRMVTKYKIKTRE